MAGKVNPVPPGFRTVTPHLVVKDGNAAIDFYKKAFGAEEICRMPGPDGKGVMHAEIKIGDSVVMLANEWPAPGCPQSPQSLKGTSICVHLYVENADAAYDRAVKAGATPSAPLMNMFWGDRYGKVTDPFGHQWSIAQHIEDVRPEDMPARMAKAFSEMGGCGS